MKLTVTFTDTTTAGLTTAWDFANNPNNDSANDDIWHIDATLNNGYPLILGVGYGEGLNPFFPIVTLDTPADNKALSNPPGNLYPDLRH